MYARHNRKALAHLQRAHELLRFGMKWNPQADRFEESDSDDEYDAVVIPPKSPTQDKQSPHKRDIIEVDDSDEEDDVKITQFIPGDKRAKREQSDHARQSTSSSDTQTLRVVSLDEMRKAKVGINGSLQPVPAALVTLISDCDLASSVRMLDVQGGGNCGDNVLAAVHFSIANQDDLMVQPSQIRKHIWNSAKENCKMSEHLLLLYKECLDNDPVKGVRFLEYPELALFCDSLELNCCFFHPHQTRGDRRKRTYIVHQRDKHKNRPWAMFINTGLGTHYELMIKNTQTVRGTQAQVYLLFSNNEARSMLDSIEKKGGKIEDIATCGWLEMLDITLEANELEYMPPPEKEESISTRGKRGRLAGKK